MNLSSVSNFDETQTNYCLRALQLTADPESLSEYVGAKYPALSLSLLLYNRRFSFVFDGYQGLRISSVCG